MTARKNSRSHRTAPASQQVGASAVPVLATKVEPAKALRLLRLANVMDMTGLGKTKIYALQAEGKFPMRVQITAYSVGWIEHEVQAWIAERIAARSALPTRRNREDLAPLSQ